MTILLPLLANPKRRSPSPLRWLALVLVIVSTGCHAPSQAILPPKVARVRANAPVQPNPEQWRSAVPAAGADTPWTYPVPQVAKLSNHLSVYVLPRTSGAVSISLVIRHGGSEVPPQKCGLASIAVEMLAEATKTKNHHVLSETVEALGSTLIADANRDYVQLTLDTLPEDVATGISLLAETVTQPAFDATDFARLQKQHIDDLVSERQVPERLAAHVGLLAVLGETLGAPVSGRLSSVRRLTIEDVRGWHRTHAYPEGIALLVVGPVETNTVLSAAEKALGHLRGSRPVLSVPPQPAPPASTEIYVVDRPGSVQSAIFVAQPYPNRRSPGYAARQVLNNVIGGQFTSRINQNLREKHAYTYGAHSTTVAARHFGLLTISTSVETDVTAPAIQQIIQELVELRGNSPLRPITEEELTRARAGIIENLGAHLEDGHRQLQDLEQLFVYELAPDYLSDYLTEVRSLPSRALLTESDRITPEQLSIVVVGDGARLASQFTSTNLKVHPAPADWVD
jgi:zinc protease